MRACNINRLEHTLLLARHVVTIVDSCFLAIRICMRQYASFYLNEVHLLHSPFPKKNISDDLIIAWKGQQFYIVVSTLDFQIRILFLTRK